MELDFTQLIAKELSIQSRQVDAAIRLLKDGNTIPFIARYRKEATGELDEETLRAVDERWRYLEQLSERKREVIRLIDEQDKLTDELREQIEKATKLQEVEDLYRPYRPKRKTRASVAKERGLEPLARHMAKENDLKRLLREAQAFVSEENGVPTPEDAIQGASDILAEDIADRADIRQWVRRTAWAEGVIRTEARDASVESVYEMYYDYEEAVKSIRPHRVLAINRGEREEILRVNMRFPEERILSYIGDQVFGQGVKGTVWEDIVRDSYKRLIAPAVERDIRKSLTEKAEEQAIRIFSENLRHLLLQPPIRHHVVMGVDPAYRTGCKLAVVDDTGKLLHVEVCYPTPPQNKIREAKDIFHRLIEQYGISLIAIGNGTASRETERFVAEVIREFRPGIVLRHRQ